MEMQEYLDNPKYKHEYCQQCIHKCFKKYGKFECPCDGIHVEENVDFAIKNGLSEHDARWIYDTVYFFEQVYGSPARWYQKPILLCTSRNLASRQCRQTGKTLAIALKVMHYVTTNERKTVLIVTPGEKQIKKIYDEYLLRDCISKSSELKSSIQNKGQKPFYYIDFNNESRIILMIANEGARGQTADWLYIDEAALIPLEILNSIIMTRAAAGADSVQIQTSTPKGRGNLFYKSCKEDPTCNEYHVPITVVEEMVGQIDGFRNLLGETGFDQECMAEFPNLSDGPFNYHGIDLARQPYLYNNCVPKEGMIYIGGVDWNGPTIGTFLTVIEFDQTNYFVRVVESKVVSSVEWNSLTAKQALIDLNRKWGCAHWMVDYGFSQSIVEELRSYSMKITANVGNNHPDAKLKYIIDAIEFGSLLEIKDPFTKEIVKKTTRSFMVSQVARLFEPYDDKVRIAFSDQDINLSKSLESYKLLNVTARGFEQYGFEKGSGIEDHCYTPGHEVLTFNGWKNIEDVTLSDIIATSDNFGNLIYDKPLRIINNNFSGELVCVNTRGISYEVTDKHRLTYIPVKKYFKKEFEIESEPADELTPYLLKVPAAAFNYKRHEYNMSNDEIYLFGMFQSEGCTNINHHHYRTIWDQKDPINIVKIRNALNKVYPNIFSERVNKLGCTRFEIQKMEIYNKYKKYGKCDYKFIDREYLNNFSKRQLEILYEGLMDGDGHYENGPHGASHYTTTSLQLANDFQEICLKLGKKTTFQILKMPKDKPHWKQCYRIGIHRTENCHTYTKKHIERKSYNGPVHCVTVKTGLLFIRHNGKVHIGSNCQDSFNLAIFGIVKYYGELFKRIVLQSVTFGANSAFLSGSKEQDSVINIDGLNKLLVTDNDLTPIEKDEAKIKERSSNINELYVSRSFNRAGAVRRTDQSSMFGIHRTRQGIIRRTI